MSHFYASITGKAPRQLTRTGNKTSGLSAHVRSWDHGVRIVAKHVDGTDLYHVFKTGGNSNPTRHQRLIATIRPDTE